MPAAAISKALRESGLFSDLSDQEQDKIALLSHEMTFETGDVLFNEGDSARQFISRPSRNAGSGGGASRAAKAALRHYSDGAPGRVCRMVGGDWLR